MSSTSKRLRKLQEIYDQLPSVQCRGLCTESCAAIPAYDIELTRLRKHIGRSDIPLVDNLFGQEIPRGASIIAKGARDVGCPFLVLKRCSVYEARPLICRIFGVARGLPCPHGCVPDRELTEQEVAAILRQIEKL